MRAFQGKVGQSWLNKWVRPIFSTTHRSLSSAMRVRPKSNTITIFAPTIFTDFPALSRAGNHLIFPRSDNYQPATSTILDVLFFHLKQQVPNLFG